VFAALLSAATLTAASVQTLDKVSSRPATFEGGAAYSADGGGHTGVAGDSAADFTSAGVGHVLVPDASFMDAAGAADEVSVAFWAKAYQVADSSGFWVNSPASGGGRGIQAHIPWSNNHIYFDTAGCCGGNTRIESDIANFANYSGDPSWFSDWHLYVFSKKADDKQIWIDGTLFLEGTGASPLQSDFTTLFIGSDGNGNGVYHGLIDDFAVYSTQLLEGDIQALASGTLPTALDPALGLLAYWDFNDPPSEGQILSVSPQDGTASAAPNLIQVVHLDGAVAWSAATVSLSVDGNVVTPSVVTAAGRTTVTFVPASLFAVGSAHTAVLTYPTAGQPKTLSWSFVVGPYTRDSVAARIGQMTWGSAYTASAGGHTGQPGDYAVDFGPNGSGPVVVSDASFMNVGAAADTLTVAFWAKKYDTAAGSAFWALSPSSNNGQRGYQAHVPWNDNNVYFDSAGCCNGGQRLSGSITTFGDYSGDVSWWNDWHYYVFSKGGVSKQVWIDGKLFLDGSNASPLPTDFTSLMIGSDFAGGGLFHAVVDDFAVFSTQLTEEQVVALASGGKASDLSTDAGLVAYWDFNDIPAEGLFLSVSPTPGGTNAAPDLIKVVHQNGTAAWDLGKVSLKVDGVVAPGASVVQVDDKVTVSLVPTPLFAPRSAHNAELIYPGPGNTLLSKAWSFTVATYSKDALHQYVGTFEGAAVYTADAGGHSGAPGDYGVDLGPAQNGQSVHIKDASFLNEALANDEFAVSVWEKLYSIHDSSLIWVNSPGSGGGSRGINAHAPWGDNNIYYDTAGCCGGDTRISSGISSFPPYQEVGDVSWWTSWHHLVFQKKADVKEIWIDGQLFLSGSGSKVMLADVTDAFIGSDAADGVRVQGVVDDVAFFKTALAESDIQQIASGVAPTSLDASLGLLAFWDFNDAGGVRRLQITGIVRNNNDVVISWANGTGPFTVEFKASLSDANWTPVAQSAGNSATVAIQGNTGFFRVTSGN
jgi:hypothetical protein